MVERDIDALCIRLSGGTTELRPVPARDTQFLLLDHGPGQLCQSEYLSPCFQDLSCGFRSGGIFGSRALEEVLNTIFPSCATEDPPWYKKSVDELRPAIAK
jgi:hypothetical protein